MDGCVVCKNYGGGVRCRAYPDGIPWPILSGEIDHYEPIPSIDSIPDDQGIVFEPIDDEDMTEVSTSSYL